MGVIHNAFGQDGFFVNEWDTNMRSETAVGDVVNPFKGLNNEVLHLVGGNDDLCGSGPD